MSEMTENQRALSQFNTPAALAERIVDWAMEPYRGGGVLEPSAGSGSLVRELLTYTADVTAVEIDPVHSRALVDTGAAVFSGDFRLMSFARRFAVAVMNPPFEDNQAAKHILHALTMCDRVVAHVPLTTLATKWRLHNLWSGVIVTRMAICATRPRYNGEGGKTDMMTIEVIADTSCAHSRPTMEWWA